MKINSVTCSGLLPTWVTDHQTHGSFSYKVPLSLAFNLPFSFSPDLFFLFFSFLLFNSLYPILTSLANQVVPSMIFPPLSHPFRPVPQFLTTLQLFLICCSSTPKPLKDLSTLKRNQRKLQTSRVY